MENLNENDKDLQLAKKLNQLLEEGNLDTKAYPNDSLLRQLLHFRAGKTKQISNTSVPSDRIWNTIQDGLNKQTEATIHKLSIRQKTLLWASIAAIVLISIITFSYFQTSPKPVLLASSETSIQIYTFHDGSKVTLRPHSQLFLEHHSKNVEIYKLSGEGFFNIIHNPQRTFIIDAGHGKVTDLGTRFDLSNWGGNIRVFVQKGSVALQSNKNRKSVTLKTGDYCSISANGQLSQPEQKDQSQFLDWMNNEMIFDHQSVTSVFKEIEQQYNIKITVPGKSIVNETVSGQIHLDNITHSLNDLAIVLGGKFIKINDSTYHFVASK